MADWMQSVAVKERFPDLLEEGNIDLTKRPKVKNPDGSVSTVLSMSFQDDDGAETLIPRVTDDGRIVDENEAVEIYRKTKKHLGKFRSPEAATAFAEWLHEQQEQQYGEPE